MLNETVIQQLNTAEEFIPLAHQATGIPVMVIQTAAIFLILLVVYGVMRIRRDTVSFGALFGISLLFAVIVGIGIALMPFVVHEFSNWAVQMFS